MAIDPAKVEDLFRQWFKDNYGIPPTPHAAMVSTGFALWLLANQPEESEQAA